MRHLNCQSHWKNQKLTSWPWWQELSPVSPMPPVEVENDGLLVLFQWLSVKLRPLPEPTKPPKLPPDPPLRVTEPEA